ncbi:ATP-binding protein [Chitinivorax sp. B]|uniref:sensor histidine kinase n=1 Tax=Chitinivorax sp. B TaxID=2502235 RepID=UPI0010F6ECC2|nr:ATP-binding protein [Chitinivorax sp. B]
MPITTQPMDQDRSELEQAFAMFTEASRQLTDSYAELQQQAQRLTDELGVANGELKRQYAEKASLSERLVALMQALPAGVVELDDRRRIVALNAAADGILGSDVMGQTWDALLSTRLIALDTPGEWRLSDVHDRILNVVENGLAGSGGFIVLLHDLSEPYQMRIQLAKQQRLVEMGRMSAALAHQLRTPLSTAMLYCANLTRPALAEEDRKRFSNKALERMRVLEHLIQDMLRFVKGAAVAGTEQVAVAELLDEVDQVMEPQASLAQLIFVVDQSVGGAMLTCDRQALSGALLNLLDNAIRACQPGQQVRLEARVANSLHVTISDGGCGMSEETLGHLFEPFFTTRTDGTGLGLAIVKQVVEAHGGHITVESRLGLGTRFAIELPLVDSVAIVNRNQARPN